MRKNLAVPLGLLLVIEDGKGKMPAFKGKLTNVEVASLVKYIRSFKK